MNKIFPIILFNFQILVSSQTAKTTGYKPIELPLLQNYASFLTQRTKELEEHNLHWNLTGGQDYPDDCSEKTAFYSYLAQKDLIKNLITPWLLELPDTYAPIPKNRSSNIS